MNVRSFLRKHRLHNTWSKVPIDYYQKGMKRNVFQWIWHSHKINSAKKIFKNLKFNRCLDIGCTSGYMISEIAKSHPQVKFFGIDVYDKAIDFARKIYSHIDFKLAPADDLPFKNNFLI